MSESERCSPWQIASLRNFSQEAPRLQADYAWRSRLSSDICIKGNRGRVTMPSIFLTFRCLGNKEQNRQTPRTAREKETWSRTAVVTRLGRWTLKRLVTAASPSYTLSRDRCNCSKHSLAVAWQRFQWQTFPNYPRPQLADVLSHNRKSRLSIPKYDKFRFRCYSRQTVGQSVLVSRPIFGTRLDIFYCQTLVGETPSLTRGRVCCFQFLLALASSVLLG
jgi:hypothetical protein